MSILDIAGNHVTVAADSSIGGSGSMLKVNIGGTKNSGSVTALTGAGITLDDSLKLVPNLSIHLKRRIVSTIIDGSDGTLTIGSLDTLQEHMVQSFKSARIHYALIKTGEDLTITPTLNPSLDLSDNAVEVDTVADNAFYTGK